MIREPKILRRFEQVRAAILRYQAWFGLAATALAMATGLALLAWLDYRLELPRSARAGVLALATLAIVAVLARWLVAPIRWWTRPRTAAEIEGRFPELGQRIRTVVQFAGLPDERIAGSGARPSLVEALHEEAEGRTSALPLDRVVPWRKALALSALAAVPVALLAYLAASGPEWRVAIARALLVERPYTTIAVKPGDVLVDQGQNVAVAVELRGRSRKSVELLTRPAGKPEAPWKREKLDDLARGATLEKVKDGLEYRVVAGPAGSPTYAVRVRYPLAIRDFEVEVKHPAYTGLEPRTIKGGDIQAVEGSVATFKITFDAPPDAASLELVAPSRTPSKKGEPVPRPIVLPLRPEGKMMVASLDLARDLDYHVEARTVDGRISPVKKYRIDVREDRAPRVVFDEPDEALEVHPIAEVRHRARVDDDYGLSRAGIVFRFNDGEEKTLLLKDFPPAPGKKPKTADRIEEVLLLETLAATPQDSVTYFAFAEDNFPGNARRTETDLRYIDIRAFKREYKLAEPGSGDGDPLELTSLDELIARQRVNLNRATRLAKHRPTDRTEADDPLKIAGFEESLLTLTKEFTEGIEALADARVDALHKAIDAMQASMDALDRSKFAEAPPAMAEAHRQLIAARRELGTLIGEDSPLAAQLRAFDRRQAQKIRKPKSKDEQAEEIAQRLEALADEEDFVYATLTAAAASGSDPPSKPSPAAKEPAKAESKEAPKKEGEPKEAEAKDPAKAQDEPKPEQGKGPKGKGLGASPGQGGEGDEGDSKKLDRRALADKQQAIADEVRDLEEKLKGLEMTSDLAKARIAKAAEKVEQAAGAMTRGNTKGAADDAKAGAGMLHEVARQVKGEIAREATDQLAMARDLAEDLARREAGLADQKAAAGSPSTSPSDSPGAGPEGKPQKGEGSEGDAGKKADAGKAGEGDQPGGEQGKAQGKDGKGEGKEGEGEGKGQGRGPMPGQGGRGGGSWAGLTEEEQIERMAEMARTLQEWLGQIDKRREGKAADAVREILDSGAVAEIVERSGQMADLRAAGKDAELGREARQLAARLETLGQALELIHRGVVAPELAAMVEFDRRLAELNLRLETLTTEAEVAAWKLDAATLVRDLEKAGVAGAADLGDALRVGGAWHWDVRGRHLVPTAEVYTAVGAVTVQIKDRVQDLILKDLASARDEATPPEFRELVERYYEVISRGMKSK